MPRLSELRIPPPEKGDAFERLCLDLWREVWREPHIELHGRLGQRQRGIDIYGRPEGAQGYWGIQCKVRGPHTNRTRFTAELRKDIEAARAFAPPLEALLVVTTLDSDAVLQRLERELDTAETNRGSFRVQFVFWKDVLVLLESHLSVARKHIPNLFVSETEPQTLLPPKLPPNYFVRIALLQRLKTILLEEAPNEAITGEGMLVLHGTGGIGKTVLAAALAWDVQVKTAFPDGIFWLTVGQKPNLPELLRKLAQALGTSSPLFTDTTGGKTFVRGLCATSKLLLIIDDIWSTNVAEVLDVAGTRSRTLITTRNAEVASFFGATSHQIDLMEEADALAFLSHCSRRPAADLPDEAELLLRECGGLPLAIAMIGGMLRGGSAGAWTDALDLLRGAKLEEIRRAFPDYPYPDLLRALGVSVDALEPQQKVRYFDFAAFEDDVPIPEPTIVMLWESAGLKPLASRRLLTYLKDRSLLHQDSQGRFSLHNLLHAYVRRNAESCIAVHQRLVEAYRGQSQQRFASGPDDGYYFQWLPVHLAVVGLHDELQKLLTADYAWLDAMLRATDIYKVISTYRLLDENPAAELIQSALILSSSVLAVDGGQLPHQLLSRISAQSRHMIPDLLIGASLARNPPYLEPRQSVLEEAGGPLWREYNEYATWMTAVAIIDSKRFVSVPLADFLIVRELATGNRLHVLTGHTAKVTAVATMERLIISGSEDRTVRVWHIDTGIMLHMLAGHEGSVLDVATLGGHLIISASLDKTVRVWDSRTGELLNIYREHAGQVHHVAAVDHRRVVSADIGDGAGVRVWDAISGETLHAVHGLRGPMAVIDHRWIVSAHGNRLHIWDIDTQLMWCTTAQTSGGINAIVALEGRKVLSGSDDGMLRIWDVETGACLQSQKAHVESVRDADALGTNLVLSASLDGTVRAWNLDVCKQPGNQRGYNIGVNALAAMDNLLVASASSDGNIYLYNALNREMEGMCSGHRGVVNRLARLDTHRLVSVSHDGTLRVWDIRTQSSVGTWNPSRPGRIAALSPDIIIFGGDDGRLAIIDVSTGSVRLLEGHREEENYLLSKEITAITPVGERFVTAARHSTLRVWNTAAEVPDVSIDTPEEVRSLAVLDNGLVVAGTRDGNLLLFDVERGALVRTLKGRAGWVHTVAAVDSRYVLSCSARVLCIWDMVTGLVAHRFPLDTSTRAMCIMNERRSIVIGDALGKVCLMDLIVK